MEALKGRFVPALAWLACLIVLLMAEKPFEQWESSLEDALVLRAAPPASDLVLVDIDETSLIAEGAWPWSRALLGEVAEKISLAGARRQAWDLLLAEPRPGDELLKKQLQKNSITLGIVPVIDPMVDSPPQTGTLGTHPGFTAKLCAADSPFPESRGHLGIAETVAPNRIATGHLTPIIDGDGRLRKLPAIVCHEGQAIPSLMLGIALHHADEISLERGTWPWSAPWYLRSGQSSLPLDANGNIALDFRTRLGDYLTIPAHRILSGDIPAETLRGKTVLLGSSALGLGDRVATRLSSITPGMAVHAELYSRLQHGDLPTPMRHGWTLGLLLASIISLPCIIYRRGARRVLPALALLTALFGIYLLNQGAQIAILPILIWHAIFGLALLLLQLVEEKQAQRQHQRRLASIIPPALLEQLDPDAPQDIVTARRRSFGIVHGQLRNLPQFANRAEPETVLAVFHALNRLAQQIANTYGAQLYPSEMQEFLLMWPDLSRHTDLPRMLQASRELHRGVTQLLANLDSTTGLALEIAVHADEALDGFIGSRDRRRPILYGHLRQVSQAMLALSAELASPITITDAALPGNEDEFALRSVGKFKLEDIRQPFNLYACTQTLDPLPESEA